MSTENTQLTAPTFQLMDIPGAVITPTSLTISKDITREQADRLSQMLGLVGSCHAWWIGDYVQQKRIHRELRPVLQLEFGFASEVPTERYASTAQYWPSDMRKRSLTYQHHETAMQLCGDDLQQAEALLEAAERDKLTVAAMRKKHRQSQAQYIEEKRTPPGSGYSQLTSFARWCQQKCTSRDIPQSVEQAEAILEDLQPVIDYIRAVEGVLGEAKA